MLVALVAVGLGFSVAYFDKAELEGDAYLMACACGLTPATVSDGKITLAEPNHDTPAGTVVATIAVQDDDCTVTLVEEDGTPRVVYELTVDHLGARYLEYHEGHGTHPVYVVQVDNWKLYPASLFVWADRKLR